MICIPERSGTKPKEPLTNVSHTYTNTYIWTWVVINLCPSVVCVCLVDIFTCPYCPRVFTLRIARNRHLLTHEDQAHHGDSLCLCLLVGQFICKLHSLYGVPVVEKHFFLWRKNIPQFLPTLLPTGQCFKPHRQVNQGLDREPLNKDPAVLSQPSDVNPFKKLWKVIKRTVDDYMSSNKAEPVKGLETLCSFCYFKHFQ